MKFGHVYVSEKIIKMKNSLLAMYISEKIIKMKNSLLAIFTLYRVFGQILIVISSNLMHICMTFILLLFFIQKQAAEVQFRSQFPFLKVVVPEYSKL